MKDPVEAARTCPLREINPMHPEMLKRPYVMNERYRTEAPVHQDPHSGIYFISDYASVLEIPISQGPPPGNPVTAESPVSGGIAGPYPI